MLGKPSKKLIKQLEENGKHANATVVEIAEKGMAVTRGAEGVISNTELALKAHLRVQPDDEPEFEVKKRFSFPQLAVPSAGQTVPVLYDPADHDKIVVDYSAEAQQGAAFSAAGIDPNQIGQLMEQAQQMQAQAGQMQGGMPGMGQMPGMTPPAPAQPQADPVEQLEKLAKLKESGALTEAEFEAEKAKVLSQ
jgi:putative oligomerization/nucleic acid binding protein